MVPIFSQSLRAAEELRMKLVPSMLRRGSPSKEIRSEAYFNAIRLHAREDRGREWGSSRTAGL